MVKTNSGHMLVHNCGYQGGAAAIQTFAKAYGVKMADHWGTIRAKADASYVIKAQENLLTGWGRDSQRRLEIDDLEWVASETVKLAWRGRHPATRQLWYDVESAAKSAIQQPGVVFQAGQHLSYMSVARMGQKWLLGKLPSGKYLTYFNPRLTQDGGICYDGNGSEEPGKPSIWCTLYTHGGKLVGNACQATAGDILKSTMPAIEAAGYGVVLTVHDEAVTEAPDEPRYSAKHLSELLATNPPWAPGLPLAAAGFEAYRYCKED
jgi:DNA polymerase